jgi:hypothetical protein
MDLNDAAGFATANNPSDFSADTWQPLLHEHSASCDGLPYGLPVGQGSSIAIEPVNA